MPHRPPLILVHSPLVGPATWDAVASELTSLRWRVAVPSLVPTLQAVGSHLVAQGTAIAAAARHLEGPPVLIGHSGAGPRLPAYATFLPTAVHAYVFVDARLPFADGRSWWDESGDDFAAGVDVAAEGALPPWIEWWSSEVLEEVLRDPTLRAQMAHEARPTPVAMLMEPVQINASWQEAKCAYLLLSEHYESAASEATQRGWPVERLKLGHLATMSDPGAVTDALVRLLARLDQ